MSIYKIVVPGTDINMELEANSLEKNSAGAVILSDESGASIGAFPRETIAYKIDASPWQNKINHVRDFILNIQSKIHEESSLLQSADVYTPEREERLKQVVADYGMYLKPILDLISDEDPGGETKAN